MFKENNYSCKVNIIISFYFKGIQDLFEIRCGKTCRHEDYCHERSFYINRFVETRGKIFHAMPHKEAPGSVRM